MAETKNEAIVIPTIEPKNLEKKGTEAILKVIVSYVANDMQSKFISEYGNKMKEMPFELEGVLYKKNGWGAFVIDFMIQACKLLKAKDYKFVSTQKISKICAISFLGLLDIYELNQDKFYYNGKYFKYKNTENALCTYERTIAICSKYGISLDETDIECISMYKHIENGDKMTLFHASPTARLVYASYQLTKVDFSL